MQNIKKWGAFKLSEKWIGKCNGLGLKKGV